MSTRRGEPVDPIKRVSLNFESSILFSPGEMKLHQTSIGDRESMIGPLPQCITFHGNSAVNIILEVQPTQKQTLFLEADVICKCSESL